MQASWRRKLRKRRSVNLVMWQLLRLLGGVSGVLTSLVGGGAIAYLLVVPVYRGTGCVMLPDQPTVCQATYATLLNGADPGTRGALVVAAALLLAVGTSAVWHAHAHHQWARGALYASTGALTLWTLYPWLVPGPALLPSVALALVACAASVTSASHLSQGTARR